MKRNLIFTITIISFFGVSCVAHSYYTPSPHQVPMFKEKGEFSAQGTVNTNGMLDGQAAYAMTDHIAVMGGAALVGGKTIFPADNGFGGHFNLATGYFTPLFGGNTLFQIYGGMERGEYKFEYVDRVVTFGFLYPYRYEDNGSAYFAFNKFYLMPSVGYTHQIFDIAFSLRMAHLSFAKVENNVTKQNSYAYNTVEGLRDIGNSILFEPALTFRLGWEYFKVQTQIGWSFNAMHHSSGYFDEMCISTGFYFIFAKRYKKQPIPLE